MKTCPGCKKVRRDSSFRRGPHGKADFCKFCRKPGRFPVFSYVTISQGLFVTPWNYSCGLCQTNFMGVAGNLEDASAWGEKHQLKGHPI